MAQRKPNEKHPKKDIEKVLKYAEDNGWIVELSKHGHTWGKMKCPQNNIDCRGYRYCITFINSTPRSSSDHAEQLKKAVDGCLFKDSDENEVNNEQI